MIRESADVTGRDAPMTTQNKAGGEPAGPPMRVLETGVFRGPHLYGSLPMVRIQVDLGAMEDWPSDRLRASTSASSPSCRACTSTAAATMCPAASCAGSRTAPGWAMWPSTW